VGFNSAFKGLTYSAKVEAAVRTGVYVTLRCFVKTDVFGSAWSPGVRIRNYNKDLLVGDRLTIEFKFMILSIYIDSGINGQV